MKSGENQLDMQKVQEAFLTPLQIRTNNIFISDMGQPRQQAQVCHEQLSQQEPPQRFLIDRLGHTIRIQSTTHQSFMLLMLLSVLSNEHDSQSYKDCTTNKGRYNPSCSPASSKN
ncbi:MAG: hypothetical protein GY696_34510 [Gammaproteobacteria bacterium]|nr:hypothetical protein [Gammaproteobacteria bacterium]